MPHFAVLIEALDYPGYIIEAETEDDAMAFVLSKADDLESFKKFYNELMGDEGDEASFDYLVGDDDEFDPDSKEARIEVLKRSVQIEGPIRFAKAP